MSRKAKINIVIPKGVSVTVDRDEVSVKGSKGELQQKITHSVVAKVENESIRVYLPEGKEDNKAFLGLYWSIINNMVVGVHHGFEKSLEMIGVGYRAAVMGKQLDVQVGFSHPTRVTIPEGVSVEVEKNTLIKIRGVDKRLVGQFAANIRSLRPPEPYKGKGIRYVGEYVRRKAGKAGKAGKK